MDVRVNQHFVWDAVEGAVDYRVELSKLDGTVEAQPVVTETSILVGDLIAGVTGIALGDTRRVRVRARSLVGGTPVGGDYTDYLTFVLVGLSAPENLRVE